MSLLTLGDVPWIESSTQEFRDWLVANPNGQEWSPESFKLPGIYRWTVSYITYESLFVDQWDVVWFQKGMQAFALRALEIEGIVRFHNEESLMAVCPSGDTFEIADFLSGHSISFRNDPEFCDLSWDPVNTTGHLLAEYYPGEDKELL